MTTDQECPKCAALGFPGDVAGDSSERRSWEGGFNPWPGQVCLTHKAFFSLPLKDRLHLVYVGRVCHEASLCWLSRVDAWLTMALLVSNAYGYVSHEGG